MSERPIMGRASLQRAGSAVCLLIAMSTNAVACTICIGMPDHTAADVLIASDCVVLAREHPEKPFSYAPDEVLKGRVKDDTIDLLVDSVTRRLLRSDPARSIVLVQDVASRRWQRLSVATPAYQHVLRQVVLLSSEWRGEAGRRRRIEYFVALFGDADPAIHQLAYLELGRAPYRVVRELSERVERNEIALFLDRAQYFEWRSLAILLLARNRQPAVRHEVVETFHTAARRRQASHLAAWATAAIEVDQSAAIAFIRDRYLSDASRSEAELTAVLQAMSQHGTQGHTHLRDEIVAAYQAVLEVHPKFAGLVARDLKRWNRNGGAR